MCKEIEFHYGIFCKSLEQQANEQGYTLGNKQELLEMLREAINRCLFSEVATNSQVNRMFKKLQKQVVKALEVKENK